MPRKSQSGAKKSEAENFKDAMRKILSVPKPKVVEAEGKRIIRKKRET